MVASCERGRSIQRGFRQCRSRSQGLRLMRERTKTATLKGNVRYMGVGWKAVVILQGAAQQRGKAG